MNTIKYLRLTFLTTCVFLLSVLPCVARAQAQIQKTESLHVELAQTQFELSEASVFELDISFELVEPFYLYADTARMNLDPTDPYAAGEATKIVLSDSVDFEITEIVWPDLYSEGKWEYFHAGEVYNVKVFVTNVNDLPVGDYDFNVIFKGLTCIKGGMCLPQEIVFPVSVTTLQSISSSLDFAGQEDAPAADESSESNKTDDEVNAVQASDAPASIGVFSDINAQLKNKGKDLDAKLLLTILFGAFAGGMVLNFTPCVLPVIPLKIMGLMQHGGSRSRTIFLGGLMFLGVVSFWGIIGIFVVSLTNFTPSQLIATWWVTLSIGVLIAIMSVGMLGVWNIQLPQAVYRINPSHDSVHGAFLFGVMTAVLALPCTGPFLGTAISAATQSGRTWLVLVVFFTLGIGMGIPYILLLLFPKLLEKLPRAGAGSNVLKQFLGLLMLAAGFYFISMGIGSYLSGMVSQVRTVLNNNSYELGLADGGQAMFDTFSALLWWPIWLTVIVASLFLCIKTFVLTKNWYYRFNGFVVSLVLMIASGYMLSAFGLPEKGMGLINEHDTHVQWVRFTDEAQLKKLLDDGNVLAVDFTANWCPNCKMLEKTRWETDMVLEVLNKPGIIPLQVDLTASRSEDPRGWHFLDAINSESIPQMIILSQNADNEIIIHYYKEWYSKKELADAISSARNDAGIFKGSESLPVDSEGTPEPIVEITEDVSEVQLEEVFTYRANEDEPIKITLEVPQQIVAGETFDAICTFDIPEGWHIYSELARKPSGSLNIYTDLQIEGNNLQVDNAQWPEARLYESDFTESPADWVHENIVAIVIPLTLTKSGDITLTVDGQMCDDTGCFRFELSETIPLTVHAQKPLN